MLFIKMSNRITGTNSFFTKQQIGIILSFGKLTVLFACIKRKSYEKTIVNILIRD